MATLDKKQRQQRKKKKKAAKRAATSPAKIGFLDLLQQTPVENVKPRSKLTGAVLADKKGPVIVVKTNDTISYVFKLLATENFLSAPVMDPSGKMYCGIIDLFDLIRFTTALFPPKAVEEKGMLFARDFFEKNEVFKSASVATLMQTAWFRKRDPFHPTYAGFSFFSGWELMAKLGLHRLAVLDDHYNVAGIITQSMCISVLAQNLDKLGKIAQDTVLELGAVPRGSKPEKKDADLHNSTWSHTWSEDLALIQQEGNKLTALDENQGWHPAHGTIDKDGKTITMKFGKLTLTGILEPTKNRIYWSNKAVWYRTVLSCKEDDITIEAFNKMTDHNVSGLAIVDKEGTLVGSLSVRDLRGVGLNGEKFHRLYLPVRDFKEIVLKEFPTVAPLSSDKVPQNALYVLPTDTLETVVKRMNDGNIHRVFVVSKQSVDAKKPRVTSIITQRDVMLYVLMKLGVCRPNFGFTERAPPVWNI